MIYISEAHAKDEWPLSTQDDINQHKTIYDRIEAAKRIQSLVPIYCDSFEENNFQNVYSGWPERAFLIHNDEIKYISYHKVDGYDDWHSEVAEIIENFI